MASWPVLNARAPSCTHPRRFIHMHSTHIPTTAGVARSCARTRRDAIKCRSCGRSAPRRSPTAPSVAPRCKSMRRAYEALSAPCLHSRGPLTAIILPHADADALRRRHRPLLRVRQRGRHGRPGRRHSCRRAGVPRRPPGHRAPARPCGARVVSLLMCLLCVCVAMRVS